MPPGEQPGRHHCRLATGAPSAGASARDREANGSGRDLWRGNMSSGRPNSRPVAAGSLVEIAFTSNVLK
jgi:hypothetical protein